MSSMPWKVSGVVNERLNIVLRVQQGERVSDLCREYGISRKTAYKFIERHERLGAIGLYDERTRPERTPHRLSPAVEELIVDARKAHPTWGPAKLKAWLSDRHPGMRLPATSTFGRVLLRRELILVTRARRERHAYVATPLTMAHEANAVWCCDFKGQFRMGNKKYCYPLTVTDLYSRYLLGCEGMDRICGTAVRTAFSALFTEYGMPAAILSDNGTPFSSRAIHGLSRLSVWWLRLGIQHQRITPGHPEQNGAHERMHLTLKKETTRPAGANLLQQQERFDRFRKVFNEERPHEALGQRPPATAYASSTRPFPKHLPEPEYPLHDVTIRVRSDGGIYFNGKKTKLTNALAGELVGLREVGEHRYAVSFMNLDLGTFHLQRNPPKRAR